MNKVDLHVSPYVQDHYPQDFAWCYGCGYNNEAGLKFKTRWDGDETITEYVPRPEHIAIPGFVYGGLIASLIDCHSTGSASLAFHRQNGHTLGDGTPVPRCVTAMLKVDFIRPTPHGETLSARGRIVSLGEKKAVIATDLYAGETLVVKGEVVAVLAPETMTQKGR
ncbi:MAG: PaaI family thioesterase [Candidatus Carbobacillus sp.]|nr:PaaI family thioesterase [Candidatus Carbobacillus sp.]